MRAGVLRAALTVGSFTGVSRLTGFARDVMMAASLGAGPAADAFFVGFKLANCLRRLFAEGAFGAGFVPLFSRTLAEEGEGEARRFARDAASLLLAALLPVVALAELLMPLLVRLLAPGFEAGRFALAVELSRVMFPYIACISLAALGAAVLNGTGRFAAAAATPALLNLALVAALALAGTLGLAPVWALAWGVAAAGAVQLAWVAAACARAGFPLALGRFRLDRRLRRLLALMLPGVGGAGLGQITTLVSSWFATHLPAGAVAHLFYADRLVQLPIGLVGTALGTALLPALSRAARGGDGSGAAARAVLERSLAASLLLTLPATAGLLLLAEPIVRVLFERGAFGPGATEATAGALRAMAAGLPAAVAGRVLAPAFFAREDTATPVRVAGLSLLANVLLTLALIGPLAEAGIALAASLAAWLNAGLLAAILARRGHFAPTAAGLGRDLGRALAATAAMAAALLALAPALDGRLPEAAALALLVGAGGLGFLAVAAALGAFRELAAALGSRGARGEAA